MHRKCIVLPLFVFHQMSYSRCPMRCDGGLPNSELAWRLLRNCRKKESNNLFPWAGGWFNMGIVWAKPYLFLVLAVLAFGLRLDGIFFSPWCLRCCD